MNYLISTFDCFLFSEEVVEIFAYVKYKINFNNFNSAIVFSNDTSMPFVLDFKNESKNIVKVKNGNDCFYFIFPNQLPSFCQTKIRYKNKDVYISISDKLIVTSDGQLICEKIVDNLSYSHYEFVGDLCLIYFTGKRNYLLVLKDSEVCFSSYYDEFNQNEKEKYFMCRQYDSMNHGLVCHIKDSDCLKYLVYLDDEEMNLKEEFLSFVFLDCLKAGNLKYCNELLHESLKVKDVNEIKIFFPDFDFFYPLDAKKVVLTNKNTLAGIFEFEIENSLIFNISQC